MYKLLIKYDRPISAREVQKLLKLSSPSTAQFHLEKLEKNSFIVRTSLDEGKYVVDKLLLNHFVKFRKFLLPRYLLYALLSTAFVGGWMGLFYFGTSSVTPQAFFAIFYGLLTTLILSGTYWYETLHSIKHDKI